MPHQPPTDERTVHLRLAQAEPSGPDKSPYVAPTVPPNEAPRVSREFVEWLSAHYPHRSPTLKETVGELLFRGGQRDVVDWLCSVCVEQEQTPLTN